MNPLFHVVFAINADYFRQLRVVWTSLFTHHEPGTLCFHTLHSGLSRQQESILKSLAAEQMDACHIHHIPASRIKDLPVNPAFPSPVQFYRFFIPEYLPAGVRRALYLDTDTIVCRSLAPLMEADLQGRVAGAVEDLDAEASCVRLGIPIEASYFNSGVLLIDPERWTALEIPSRCKHYLEMYRGDPSKWKYPDQDALNVALQHLWQPLPHEWNLFACYRWFQPTELTQRQQDALLQPGVIHYTGPDKPWLPHCSPPYQEHYKHYARCAGVHFPFSLSPRAHWVRYQQQRRLRFMRSIHQSAGLTRLF